MRKVHTTCLDPVHFGGGGITPGDYMYSMNLTYWKFFLRSIRLMNVEVSVTYIVPPSPLNRSVTQPSPAPMSSMVEKIESDSGVACKRSLRRCSVENTNICPLSSNLKFLGKGYICDYRMNASKTTAKSIITHLYPFMSVRETNRERKRSTKKYRSCKQTLCAAHTLSLMNALVSSSVSS